MRLPEKYHEFYAEIRDFLIPSRTMAVYIFREMMVYFSVAFCFFFFIFFVNNILLMAGSILEKRVPLKDVALLVFYALPSVVATAAPFATMMGTLLCLGRMASDNEILSIRALGFSFRIIFFPMIAAGLIISVFSFLTNDILLPIGSLKFNELNRSIIASTPSLEITSNSVKRSGNTSMVVGEVKGSTVDEIIIFDRDSENNQRILSSPLTTTRKSNNSAVALSLDMSDGRVFVLNKNNENDFDYINGKSIVYNVFFQDFTGGGGGSVSPREMTSIDVNKEIKKMYKNYQELLKNRKKEIFSDFYYLEKLHNSNASSDIIHKNVQSIKNKLNNPPSKFSLNVYKMELYLKFSLPFGSIFFILISFPLGVMIKKRGQAAALMWGILVCFFYWAVVLGLQTLGLRNNLEPFIAMWTPNILVGIAGLILIFRVYKK